MPFAPTGSDDINARIIGQDRAKRLGQQVAAGPPVQCAQRNRNETLEWSRIILDACNKLGP